MKFTKTYQSRSANFRGHDFSVDERSLTIPDIVPTLKEIILSGAQQLVGTPMYDKSYEDGLQRDAIQHTPLETVLNARFGGEPEPAPADSDEAQRKQEDKGAGVGSPDQAGTSAQAGGE